MNTTTLNIANNGRQLRRIDSTATLLRYTQSCDGHSGQKNSENGYVEQ
jgi:hypothetical protein